MTDRESQSTSAASEQELSPEMMKQAESMAVCNQAASQLLVACIMWAFISRALQPAARGPLLAIHTPVNETLLPGNCYHEWHTMHFTMNATILMAALYTLLGATMCCAGEAVQALLVPIVKIVQLGFGCCIMFMTLRGIYITAFDYNEVDAMHCERVHNTAWWFYTGMLIINIGVCCCCGFLMLGAAGVAAAASDQQALASGQGEE